MNAQAAATISAGCRGGSNDDVGDDDVTGCFYENLACNGERELCAAVKANEDDAVARRDAFGASYLATPSLGLRHRLHRVSASVVVKGLELF